MKKILSTFLLFAIIITPTYANNNIKITIKNNQESEEVYKEISRKDIFNFYGQAFKGNTPVSYKYIDVKYSDVVVGSKLYDSLQLLIYYNLLENKPGRIYPNNTLNAYGYYTLSEKILGIELFHKVDSKLAKQRNANEYDLAYTKREFLLKLKEIQANKEKVNTTNKRMEIFYDVLSTLQNSHYDKNKLNETDFINKAIIGLTEATDDKHTTYFPPVDNDNFQSALSGEYEGIGAYVEMEKPGIFKIISPITGSPAYNAGLKGGDQILRVNGKEILEENSANEVISWIKGPKGTDVILTVLRKGSEFDLTVTRDKIIIKDIEFELINSDTYLITIKSFGPNVSQNFKEALSQLKNHNNVEKIIIDVRNNGGGYLDQVADMLSYIVPEGETTTIIKYLSGDSHYTSKGYDLIDFSKYKIVILQNSGTASASEILTGTIKDYFPDTVIIGEKSYGKGSVQRMKEYQDGSLLKYTIARWYTGGSETSIDKVGIIPDIELEFDIENYQNTQQDNQLNKAINIK